MLPKLFVFAYSEEAQPFLAIYPSKTLFQLKNIQCLLNEKENIYTLIAGSGFENVVVALSVFFERFHHLKNNIICFNIGIAGSYGKSLYSIHYASKITNYHTLKSFYPDIFIKTAMSELISISFPADRKIMKQYPEALFDMEAYSYATTCRYFVKNHQIHCIKFVSDNDGKISDMFYLLEQYENKTKDILNLVQQVEQKVEKFFTYKISKNIDTSFLQEFSRKMHLTFSQQNQLNKAIQFYLHQHTNEDIENILNSDLSAEITSKKERNQHFQQLLNKLYNV
ncbi:MAG: hypothetical protein KatS3mg027_1015 [Bacteroidia bacterium]|nr:MAG: hypothetical protein KatS3mg027_1015 [Bacteroidia bacterium]